MVASPGTAVDVLSKLRARTKVEYNLQKLTNLAWSQKPVRFTQKESALKVKDE